MAEPAPAGDGFFELRDKKPASGQAWRETLKANAYDPLLEGELAVAELIMLGYKNNDIAATTKYTLNTVKSYRKDLYSKLQIHESRELFARARKLVKDGKAP